MRGMAAACGRHASGDPGGMRPAQPGPYDARASVRYVSNVRRIPYVRKSGVLRRTVRQFSDAFEIDRTIPPRFQTEHPFGLTGGRG